MARVIKGCDEMPNRNDISKATTLGGQNSDSSRDTHSNRWPYRWMVVWPCQRQLHWFHVQFLKGSCIACNTVIILRVLSRSSVVVGSLFRVQCQESREAGAVRTYGFTRSGDIPLARWLGDFLERPRDSLRLSCFWISFIRFCV